MFGKNKKRIEELEEKLEKLRSALLKSGTIIKTYCPFFPFISDLSYNGDPVARAIAEHLGLEVELSNKNATPVRLEVKVAKKKVAKKGGAK